MVLPGWRARQALRSPRRGAPCRRRRVGHDPMGGTRFMGTDNRMSTGAPAGMTPVSGCGSVSGRLTVSRVRGMNSAWRFGAPENFSTRGADAPWTPTSDKDSKTQDSIQRPGNSETDIVVPKAGGVPVARRGTHEPRIEVPRAATQHPATAIPFTRPRSPACRRPSIALVPAVLYPLPYVPVYIVQSKSVRRK